MCIKLFSSKWHLGFSDFILRNCVSVTHLLLICIGFSKVMGTLARIGLLNTEVHSFLRDRRRPLFRDFLLELLKIRGESNGSKIGEKDISESIISSGLCKEQETAVKVAKTIMYAALLIPFPFKKINSEFCLRG